MRNKYLLLIIAIVSAVIIGLLTYYLTMIYAGTKGIDSVSRSTSLVDKCRTDSDCVGICNPYGCVNKESAFQASTDCAGIAAPDCACVKNACEQKS